jgi:hypothetical protein
MMSSVTVKGPAPLEDHRGSGSIDRTVGPPQRSYQAGSDAPRGTDDDRDFP